MYIYACIHIGSLWPPWGVAAAPRSPRAQAAVSLVISLSHYLSLYISLSLYIYIYIYIYS